MVKSLYILVTFKQGDGLSNWFQKFDLFNKKVGLWKNRNPTYVWKIMAVKGDIVPTLLDLLYGFPMHLSLTKLETMCNFLWGGYECIKQERICQCTENYTHKITFF